MELDAARFDSGPVRAAFAPPSLFHLTSRSWSNGWNSTPRPRGAFIDNTVRAFAADSLIVAIRGREVETAMLPATPDTVAAVLAAQAEPSPTAPRSPCCTVRQGCKTPAETGSFDSR